MTGRYAIRIIASGFFMGIGMILPGISWPVVAIMIGIYEPIILTLNKLISFQKIDKDDSILLLLLITGIVPALFLMSYFILKFLMNFRFGIYSIFVGLIIGTLYSLYKQIKKKGLRELIWFLAGIAAIFPLFFGRIGDIAFFQKNMGIRIVDFLAGFISSTSLPAIGDSITFILLGNYEHLLLAVKNFDLLTLLIFAAGYLVGFWIFIKIVGILLEKYHSQTFSFISGLMISSIFFIWPFRISSYTFKSVILFLTLTSIGAFISIYFGIVMMRGKNGK
ncbi:DUF368 domain-containing protein [Athalassotoga saccharophila]|uniref:DUF368 domain-containing protein n=1 Tax=Athalassotoga saccharophila TaxID=1441386 RepID=UPI0013795DC4|nr:DUF368 domain-containing protein [Athalassotoga saccharophila]BBJ28184.1 hypothetical protein ATHSA_1086 [Athalassotoga saccharophila]